MMPAMATGLSPLQIISVFGSMVRSTLSSVWKVKLSGKRRMRIFSTLRLSKACIGCPISSIR